MTSSETGLHSGEGTLGFEMVSDLFTILAFKDFRKAGQDGYRSAFQSLGISDETKERLNRLEIGIATMAVDNFRNRGSRLFSLVKGSQVWSEARAISVLS